MRFQKQTKQNNNSISDSSPLSPKRDSDPSQNHLKTVEDEKEVNDIPQSEQANIRWYIIGIVVMVLIIIVVGIIAYYWIQNGTATQKVLLN